MSFSTRFFGRGLWFLCFFAVGCAWHEVSPKLTSAPSARFAPAVVVRPVDDQTSVADLDAISKRLRNWGSATVVFFPYREGDAAELFLDIKLRQTNDNHTFTNVLRGFAIGLTFGLLSPVVGANVTEIHDVDVRVSRPGRVLLGEHRFQMRTEVWVGLGADTLAASKELDAEQMNRIAKRIVELVLADVAASGASADRLSLGFTLSSSRSP